MSDGGKGDAMRPTDRAAFNAGIERTFGVKKPWYVLRDEAKQAAGAMVCGNCDTALPEGCGGIFKKDGDACALNCKAAA